MATKTKPGCFSAALAAALVIPSAALTVHLTNALAAYERFSGMLVGILCIFVGPTLVFLLFVVGVIRKEKPIRLGFSALGTCAFTLAFLLATAQLSMMP